MQFSQIKTKLELKTPNKPSGLIDIDDHELKPEQANCIFLIFPFHKSQVLPFGIAYKSLKSIKRINLVII